MLDLQFDITLTCYLEWHFTITLAHIEDLLFESHLIHWMALLLTLENDILLDYHWDLHLNNHLNLQIMVLT